MDKEIKVFANEMKKVDCTLISSDMRYQRDVQGRIKKITSNYNPNMLGCVLLSQREDGTYWVIDGQHRVRATVLAHKDDPSVSLRLNSIVYYGMTPQDEAEVFARQHDNQKAPSKPEFFNAKLFAGNEDVAAFKKATEAEGLVCNFKNQNKRDRNLICYGAAYEIFMKRGEMWYRSVLATLIEAWDGDKDSLTANFVRGMDIFLKTYEMEVKNSDVAKALRKVSPLKIERDAKLEPTGGCKRFARRILAEYNNGKKTKRLEDKII